MEGKKQDKVTLQKSFRLLRSDFSSSSLNRRYETVVKWHTLINTFALDDPPLYNEKNSGRQMMSARITRMKSLVSAALVMVAPWDHPHTGTWTDTLLYSSTGMTCGSWFLLPSPVFKQTATHSPFLPLREAAGLRNPNDIAHNSCWRRNKIHAQEEATQRFTSYCTSCHFSERVRKAWELQKQRVSISET